MEDQAHRERWLDGDCNGYLWGWMMLAEKDYGRFVLLYCSLPVIQTSSSRLSVSAGLAQKVPYLSLVLEGDSFYFFILTN